jgi:hypothetical protein
LANSVRCPPGPAERPAGVRTAAPRLEPGLPGMSQCLWLALQERRRPLSFRSHHRRSLSGARKRSRHGR